MYCESTNYTSINSKRYVVPVTGYSLRRNFIQSAQRVTDDKKVAVLAGHQPQSVVQYTKYGSTFDTLDIVKLVKESKFGEIEQYNDHIRGMRCTVKVYGRLTKEEYEAEVVPYLSEHKQELDDIKKALRLKYKTLEAAYREWTTEENLRFTSTYKHYKNKQDIIRRKAIKKLAASRVQEALTNMRVDENGIVVEGEEG